MLEIIFYPDNGQAHQQKPCIVEVAKEFLLWLAQSDFMEIGAEHRTVLTIDGESAQLNLVKLGKGNSSNRKRLRDFFLEAIASESDALLTKLGEYPTKQEYQEATYYLRKLQELRKCIENEDYQYLQRV